MYICAYEFKLLFSIWIQDQRIFNLTSTKLHVLSSTQRICVLKSNEDDRIRISNSFYFISLFTHDHLWITILKLTLLMILKTFKKLFLLFLFFFFCSCLSHSLTIFLGSFWVNIFKYTFKYALSVCSFFFYHRKISWCNVLVFFLFSFLFCLGLVSFFKDSQYVCWIFNVYCQY